MRVTSRTWNTAPPAKAMGPAWSISSPSTFVMLPGFTRMLNWLSSVSTVYWVMSEKRCT